MKLDVAPDGGLAADLQLIRNSENRDEIGCSRDIPLQALARCKELDRERVGLRLLSKLSVRRVL